MKSVILLDHFMEPTTKGQMVFQTVTPFPVDTSSCTQILQRIQAWAAAPVLVSHHHCVGKRKQRVPSQGGGSPFSACTLN